MIKITVENDGKVEEVFEGVEEFVVLVKNESSGDIETVLGCGTKFLCFAAVRVQACALDAVMEGTERCDR